LRNERERGGSRRRKTGVGGRRSKTIDRKLNIKNNMRNRNLMQKKVEYLESMLINLERIVKTQEPIEVYVTSIRKGLDLVDEIRDLIDAESMTPNEINKF
jgi:ribosomal protein S13